MASEGEFPKIDGDILYASEVNQFQYGKCPIGFVGAWLKSYTHTPALPNGWVECNGQTLSDALSVYNGQTIPNLNGDARFLYGAASSGGTKTENFLPVHNHSIGFYQAGGDNTLDGSSAGANSTINSNNSPATGTAWVGYAVVYIMRVK